METADDLIRVLQLQPHPEGGHYRETFRSSHFDDRGRASCTVIHYLLRQGEHSHWHRVDADEIWCFHAGGPLELRISSGETTERHRLAAELSAGKPHVVVPAGMWQAARPLGTHSLVSCIVAPGFEFSGFEMAPPDWAPAQDR